MRLINTQTKCLVKEQFYEPNLPKYAILSHTWEDDEVLFQDMADVTIARQRRGWSKVSKTCDEAAQSGIEYAWVDTCCIDKSSSAELSEAINSMFHWYEQAEECYAYLSDYPHKAVLEDQLPRCRWFKRGWTLQELLAPTKIYFYDQSWKCFGSKKRLGRILSQITKVPNALLNGTAPISRFSIAQKMSWAADRQTTRIEDKAYCLMGIFDVNMPLLYGERDKAFFRLQEELLKECLDLTILAWNPAPDPQFQKFCPALAIDPSGFRDCHAYRAFRRSTELHTCVTTPRGIQMQAEILKIPDKSEKTTWSYCMPVGYIGSTSDTTILLRLCMVGPGTWARDGLSSPITEELPNFGKLKSGLTQTIRLATKASQIPKLVDKNVFVQFHPKLKVLSARPQSCWDDNRQIFYSSTLSNCGLLFLETVLEERISIMVLIRTRRQVHQPPILKVIKFLDYQDQVRVLKSPGKSTDEDLYGRFIVARYPELFLGSDSIRVEVAGKNFTILARTTDMGHSERNDKDFRWRIEIDIEQISEDS